MDFVPPILDCSPCSLENLSFQPDSPEGRKLAAELHKAFTEVGFAYIINHGVSEQEVADMSRLSDDFFNLPTDVKMKVERKKDGGIQGWTPLAQEAASGRAGDVGDYKELYHYLPHLQELEGAGDAVLKKTDWPNDDVLPGFIRKHDDFFKKMTKLLVNFLKLLPYALNLKDPDTFLNFHKKLGKAGNFTVLRGLRYPPIKDDVTEGQRCGVHSDYGTITFTLQDDVGGLELETRSGEWVKPQPLDGAILVLPGNTLEFQTSGRYSGTKHGLSFPDKTDERRYKTRRSLIFFGIPDNETRTTPLDGSKLYPDMTFEEYCFSMLRKIY